LKRHLLPKVLHELILGAVYCNTLKLLDTQVRQSFLRIHRWLSFVRLLMMAGLVCHGWQYLSPLQSAITWTLCLPLRSLLYEQLPQSRLRFPACVRRTPGTTRGLLSTRLRTVVHSLPFAKSACASYWFSSPARVFPWLCLRGIQLRVDFLSTKSRRNRRKALLISCVGGSAANVRHYSTFCSDVN
uniref:Ferric oxidoreductase domain-containing protein n=1 Tax=Schistocephalus solidus TaxID=70667 RepID=A0A183SJS4_SCHSO